MILLIDGRSGSGKTTLARRFGRVLGWPIVHLEDVYPGWGGLAAASEILAQQILNPVLAPSQRGFYRWDWHASAPAEWVPTPHTPSLIVEGCGALTADSLAAARGLGDAQVWGVWVSAPSKLRYQRAMARDDHFRSHWHMWAAQEERHIDRNRPQALADWVIRSH